MPNKFAITMVLAALSLGGVAAAQSAPARPGETARDSAGSARERHERLLKAARLPQRTQAVRDKGVPESEVREALRAARSKGVRAGEMADVAEEHGKAVDRHGPIDNFGAFVRSKLDEGLRGRELAAAIRDEHAKRGIGKGRKPAEVGKRRGAEDPGSATKPDRENKERPDSRGRPDRSAKPERPAKDNPPNAPARGNPGRGPKK